MQTPEEKLIDLDIHLHAAQGKAEELLAHHVELTALYGLLVSARKTVAALRDVKPGKTSDNPQFRRKTLTPGWPSVSARTPLVSPRLL